jgi:sec-independent protein translocase protein TatB
MFELDWQKLLVIAVVAIVFIGPKDLPRALRAVGQWTARVKRMAREFQNQFNEAIREAELDSVQRDIEEIGKIDPVADLREAAAKASNEINEAAAKAGNDIGHDLNSIAPPRTDLTTAPAATPPAVPPPTAPDETTAEPAVVPAEQKS